MPTARCRRPVLSGLLLAMSAISPATAQPKPPAAAPTATPPADPSPSAATSPVWGSFPTMLLEKVYRGPLRDTIIQRWRDPIDGSVCFLFIPISTPLLPQPAEGYMQYGPNQIGSISCVQDRKSVV